MASPWLTKGYLTNEFGDICGRYWYRDGMNAYTIRIWNRTFNGYTEKGVYMFAEEHGLQVWEKTQYDNWQKQEHEGKAE